jgi:REP element-mobilizing transposase RayT
MTSARRQTVPQDQPGAYHITSRCVRRAFLCGDAYEHRRDWVENLIRRWSPSFAVEIFGHSVMSNHYHLILKNDPTQARAWSPREVAERWSALYPLKDTDGTERPWPIEELDRRAGDAEWVEIRRERLAGISWLMKRINETISRRANQEDGCTGAFWEGRFKAVALLDQAAIIAAMAYVDLNPIRAGMAEMPEKSAYTSIAERIRRRQAFRKKQGLDGNAPSPAPTQAASRSLAEAAGIDPGQADEEDGLWFAPLRACRLHNDAYVPSLDEYLELVDATGRIVRAGKRGSIPAHLMPILERLQIDVDTWVDAMCSLGRMIGTAIGGAGARAAEALRRGVKWIADKARIHRPPQAGEVITS